MSRVFRGIKKNVSGNVSGVETGGFGFKKVEMGGKFRIGPESIKSHIEASLSSLQR